MQKSYQNEELPNSPETKMGKVEEEKDVVS